jgi:hypothetical protein
MLRMFTIFMITTTLLSQSACGQNIGFLPGDTFFHSLLTKEVADDLVSGKIDSIRYKMPTDDGWFGGFAGYWNFGFTVDDHKALLNLQAVYKYIRRTSRRELVELVNKDGASELFEKNGLHLFVYNADFDFNSYRLGMRYNETWDKDQEPFGFDPTSARLHPFVNEKIALGEDWRDAQRVPRLGVNYPAMPGVSQPTVTSGSPVNEPIKPKVAMQLVVLPSSRLEPYFRQKKGAWFFSITRDSVQLYKRDSAKWSTSEWTAPEAGN